MWILQWLPNWIFYSTLFVGVIGLTASYFIKFIPLPFVYTYKTLIQIVSIVLIVSGTFMIGASYNNESWITKVKELEEKVAKAEQKYKENVKIVTKVVEKTKVVKEKGKDIIQYVDREITKYDNQCVIPKEFVKAHNDAAEIKK